MKKDNNINPTNRIFKVMQQYICSDDDIRPAMQGMAIDGHFIIATDGHKAAIVEMENYVTMPDSGILKFDTKQAMNADFIQGAHAYIGEQYPSVSGILKNWLGLSESNSENIWESDNRVSYMDIQVSVMGDLFTFLKKIGCKNASFYMPEHLKRDRPDFRSNQPIAFTGDGRTSKDVKNVWGIVMPASCNHPIIDESIIKVCSRVETSVNKRLAKTS